MTTEKNRPVTQAIGVTGLTIWHGILGEEYLAALSPTRKKLIYREMQDDAVIATLISALTMPLISAEVGVEPADPTIEADVAAAEFLLQNMNDMTKYSWRQHIYDMLGMLAWGWSVSEIIMKKRMGPGGNPASQYDDGRLGIDILDPRGQETLERWEFDEERKGDVSFMWQRDPSKFVLYKIPAWKMIHATFGSRKRSPEGKSPLRELYRVWYTRKNLEIIEAIGAERDLAGLPMITLPSGATDDDLAKAEQIVRNVRQDEEAGIVLPAPPPGSEHGWKFQLVKSGGARQYNVREVIRDLNKIILMRFFAQFLLLGMDKVGTQALVSGAQDFFSMALVSLQQELLETWEHQLVPLLFKLNPFPGMTALPKMTWAAPGQPAVEAAVANMKALIEASILTPGTDLEDFMRSMMNLPDRPEDVGTGPRQPISPPGSPFFSYDYHMLPTGEVLLTPKKAPGQQADVQYAEVAGTTGRRERGKIEKATNEFQGKLVRLYDSWAKDARDAIVKAEKAGKKGVELESVVDEQLAEFAGMMKSLGQQGVLQAVQLGLGDIQADAEAFRVVADKVEENEKFIDEFLIPDIRAKIVDHLVEATKSFQLDELALAGVLTAMRGRVGGYSGTFWGATFLGAGLARKKDDEQRTEEGEAPRRVRWVLDPDAEHCLDSAFGFGCEGLEGTYDSWDALPTLPAGRVTCLGNCVLPGNGIDITQVQAAFRIDYSGPAIEFTTKSGIKFSVTANHPILTPEGWLRAKLLHKGDYVINSTCREVPMLPIDDNHKDIPARIEQIWDAMSVVRQVNARPNGAIMPDNFHGDGRFMDGDIDVILPFSQLGCDVCNSSAKQFPDYDTFHRGLLTQCRLPSSRTIFKVNKLSLTTPNSIVVGSNLISSLFRAHPAPLELLRFALVTKMDSLSFESVGDNPSAYTQIIRQLEDAFARLVTVDKIIDVIHFDYSGHVYDLETDCGYYLLNSNIQQRQGIVNSNCRCGIEVETAPGQWERVA